MRLVHSTNWNAGATPVPPPAHDDRPDAGAPETTLSLLAIGRMLGVWNRSEGWQANYLAALIAQEGFPAPLPTLVKDTLTSAIQPRRSQWLAVAVRAWLKAREPAPAAGLDANAATEAHTAAACRLDARADDLFGGGK